MKCSVFIATSTDGYIATPDDGVEWLDTCGDPDADLGPEADMGFNAFIASVDCLVMGRRTMEKLASFQLSQDQWPYGALPVFVLSRTLSEPAGGLPGDVRMFGGDIPTLMAQLAAEGFSHAYIDGGATITAFLELKLINELIITQAPILLGSGKPLFGELNAPIELTGADAITYPNGFVQFRYQVRYP